MPQRWAIIGGGFLGMTLAHRLAQAGHRVTLFEAAPHLGGLASAWSLGDVVWDRHYHVTLASDHFTRSMIAELGLEKELEWGSPGQGFFTGGKFYSVSNAWEFLRFPALNLWQKFRLGLTFLYALRVKDWKRLEGVLVEDWLRKLSGNRVFERIWRPLLRAKLGENYRQTSATFIWATIQRMYSAGGAEMKTASFGYVAGGYARVLERYAEMLRAEGVELRLSHRAQSVEPVAGGGLRASFANGAEETFDQVVVTTAAPVAARLCPSLTAEEKTKLESVRYLGVVCASVLLRKPLRGFYVTNITDEWVPLTGLIEMSALVKPEYLGGKTLVYLPKYVSADDAEAFAQSDEDVRRTMFGALRKMCPELSDDDLLAFRVSREKYVMALPTLHYSDRLPPMETSVPGLHIVNSAHIVNGTLNVNETVQLAERAAQRLVALPAPMAGAAGWPAPVLEAEAVMADEKCGSGQLPADSATAAASPEPIGAGLPRRLRVFVSRRLRSRFAPEIFWSFRTLLTGIGYPWEEVLLGDEPCDIAYAPAGEPHPPCRVRIVCNPDDWERRGELRAAGVIEADGVKLPRFAGAPEAPTFDLSSGKATWFRDIIFDFFWVATGQEERHWQRNRYGHLLLAADSRHRELIPAAVASGIGCWLEQTLRRLGFPEPLPRWPAGKRAAACATHDVECAEALPLLEPVRVLRHNRRLTPAALALAFGSRTAYWKFADWMRLETDLDTRSAFYFCGRRGKIRQFVEGWPDPVYDVRAPRFAEVFRQIREQGFEIGLHASFRAHRSRAQLAAEKARLEQACGMPVLGNRHHFWQLAPGREEDTLRMHGEVGLLYDTSLAFEHYSGWRRGLCWPYFPFHPTDRQALATLQIPTAWMDDHMFWHRADNLDRDPELLRRLARVTREQGGCLVSDIHDYAINEAVWPGWLQQFRTLWSHLQGSDVWRATPAEVARHWVSRHERLQTASAGLEILAGASPIRPACGPNGAAPSERMPAREPDHPAELPIEVRRMRPDEIPEVARLHAGFFNQGEQWGDTIAKLGPEFLEAGFYRPNLDNPWFFVDVACYQGKIVGFCVYVSDRQRAFRFPLRHHPGQMLRALVAAGFRRPGAVLRRIGRNLRFLWERQPAVTGRIRAFGFLLGVLPRFRDPSFEAETGIHVAGELWKLHVATLRDAGCSEFWGTAGEHNKPMNVFMKRMGGRLAGKFRVHGVPSNIYVFSTGAREALMAEKISFAADRGVAAR